MKETVGLLNKAAFEQMKDGIMIVNCARGGIVNEDDLHDAISVYPSPVADQLNMELQDSLCRHQSC